MSEVDNTYWSIIGGVRYSTQVRSKNIIHFYDKESLNTVRRITVTVDNVTLDNPGPEVGHNLRGMRI